MRLQGKPLTHWLRWLLVLPAAALGAILVSFPVHWLLILNCGLGPEVDCAVGPATVSGPYRDVVGGLERLAMAFFGPLAFVWSGQRAAPSQKVQTAVALGSLLLLFLLVGPEAIRSAGFGVDYGVPQAVLNLLGLGAGLWAAGLRLSTRSGEFETGDDGVERDLTVEELSNALRASVEQAKADKRLE